MARPAIRITLIERKGPTACHRGHRVGDSWEYDKDGGKLCPMAMHTLFPMIDILRYGGTLPLSSQGDWRFCCPDADVINIFRLEKVDRKQPADISADTTRPAEA